MFLRMATYLEEFKASVEAYIAKANLKPAGFGRAAANDPNFVSDLREGREPRFSTITKVQKWMADNPPASAEAA